MYPAITVDGGGVGLTANQLYRKDLCEWFRRIDAGWAVFDS
jgi:hypothetical protein